MSLRGRKKFVATVALAAALVVPASPAHAVEPGPSAGLAQTLEWVWQWASAILTLEPPDGLESDCDHGSHIDPDG